MSTTPPLPPPHPGPRRRRYFGRGPIYTAGWSYAYHWYNRFELDLIGLGIPFEYHFMYGFWVLRWF